MKYAGAGTAVAVQDWRGGWRLMAEFSQPFDRDEPAEVRFRGAYHWNVSKQIAVEAIVLPRWAINPPPDTTQRACDMGLSVGWELPSGFKLELAALYDWRLEARTLEATLNYSQPLKSLGAYLEWSASVGTAGARDLRPDVAGAPVHDNYSYYSASVRLPYRISGRSTVVGGLHFAESLNQSRFWSPISARSGCHVWCELGLSVDF